MLCTCYYFVYYSPLYYLFLCSRVHLLLSSPALPLPSTPFHTSIKLQILPYVPDFYSYHCRSVLVPKRRKEKKKTSTDWRARTMPNDNLLHQSNTTRPSLPQLAWEGGSYGTMETQDRLHVSSAGCSARCDDYPYLIGTRQGLRPLSLCILYGLYGSNLYRKADHDNGIRKKRRKFIRSSL